ncbi:hypothetical protein CVT26_009335 [Gymnopilus dilepis]|uniref:Uncharacterized protein n=1 Tax=Gymnopilus dilepis TaxID=231916 RepID=A0A409YA56_9AGAR|nr:hypothetical protein CVT26_009335 [Gymnopilus dilepis]
MTHVLRQSVPENRSIELPSAWNSADQVTAQAPGTTSSADRGIHPSTSWRGVVGKRAAEVHGFVEPEEGVTSSIECKEKLLTRHPMVVKDLVTIDDGLLGAGAAF